MIRQEVPGIIKISGTPAEGRGRGKVIMVEQSIFAEIDAAWQTHGIWRQID